MLDVGSGTGRAIHFLERRVELDRIEGVEPVEELRTIARRRGVVVVPGVAERLPYDDASFDAVIATGVMHHLPEPAAAVAEMIRVARRAILISDDNRFGHGPALARRIKLAIHAMGLWPAFEQVRTRGRGYMESAGDGVFYSYSVYDSLPTLTAWGDRAFVIPTGPSRAPAPDPRLVTSHGLLAALREPEDGWACRPAPPA